VGDARPRIVVVTGAAGRLGRAVTAVLGGAGHDVRALDRAQLDVTDRASVRANIASGVDWVVHCAALTDTTLCEREPRLALHVNATGAQNVADAAKRAGARLVAVSTNEVFDGAKGAPYDEDDAPAPVNRYGKSKLRGEELVMSANADALIVRTSWLYGDGDGDFPAKVRAAAAAGAPLRFVTDELAGPTYAPDLARGIVQLLDIGALGGIYHLANEGEASRFEWAQEVLRAGGVEQSIEPVTTAVLRAGGYDGPLKPPRSTLANVRALAVGVTMRPWREAFAESTSARRVPADG
jgi:dTDP-4-dehydrorhamnose reductase